MTNKNRTAITVIISFCLFHIFDPVKIIIILNIEEWAKSRGYDKLYELIFIPSWLVAAYEYFIGPFGAGLSLGAIIFSFWNPIIRYGEEILPALKTKRQRNAVAHQCRIIAGDMNQFFADQQDYQWPLEEDQRESAAYKLGFQRHYESRRQRFQSRFATRAAEIIEAAAILIPISDYEKQEATGFSANTYLQEQQSKTFSKIATKLEPVLHEIKSTKPAPTYEYELQQNSGYWLILITNRGKSDNFSITMDLAELPTSWSNKPLGLVKASWDINQNAKSEKLILKNTRDGACLYTTIYLSEPGGFVQSCFFYVKDNFFGVSAGPQWKGNDLSDPTIPRGQITLHISRAGTPSDIRTMRLAYLGVALSVISSEIPERQPHSKSE